MDNRSSYSDCGVVLFVRSNLSVSNVFRIIYFVSPGRFMSSLGLIGTEVPKMVLLCQT